jgi:hypothetical protein
MRTFTKIVLIVVIFMVFGLITVALKGGENRPGVGGPVGIILMFGVLAAIRAIWKYNPEKEQSKGTTADNQTLDKRNPS